MSAVVAVGNLCEEKPGDLKMIKFLSRRGKRLAKKHDASGVVLHLTEYQGKGKKSVRVRVLGALKAFAGPQRWRRITSYGVHNHVAIRDIIIEGREVRHVTPHGLHRRSVGRVRQAGYYVALVALLAAWTAKGLPWVLAGDFNLGVRKVARMLGGKGVGHGVDGVVVSRKMWVRLLEVSRRPLKKGWSDHAAVFALVGFK